MIHVAVGSNLQPHVHVPAAVRRLGAAFGAIRCSPFYEVPAIDRPEQPHYWNGVVAMESALPRGSVEGRLRSAEEAEGRTRTSDAWAARTLDLDILGWHGQWSPDLQQRRFLARCLADLGDLPADMQAPPASWPVAWTAQAET